MPTASLVYPYALGRCCTSRIALALGIATQLMQLAIRASPGCANFGFARVLQVVLVGAVCCTRVFRATDELEESMTDELVPRIG